MQTNQRTEPEGTDIDTPTQPSDLVFKPEHPLARDGHVSRLDLMLHGDFPANDE